MYVQSLCVYSDLSSAVELVCPVFDCVWYNWKSQTAFRKKLKEAGTMY